MDKNTLVDKLSKMIGNYIASKMNNNELLKKCDSITAIENVIDNINNTITNIGTDDPILTTKLKEYKIKKEQEKDQLINITMYDILPKPAQLSTSDYTVNESEPNKLVLKDSNYYKSDSLKTVCDILNELKTKKKSRSSSSSSGNYYSPSCGSSSSSYGGCGC